MNLDDTLPDDLLIFDEDDNLELDEPSHRDIDDPLLVIVQFSQKLLKT